MEHLDTLENVFSREESGKVYRSVIDRTEKVLIEKALEQTAGNQIAAARILGLNRNTLRYKIKKLNVCLDHYRV